VKSILRALRENHTELLLLPPTGSLIPPSFRFVDVNPTLYGGLLASLQRFRGRTYLDDGAISPSELSSDGRHVQPIDAESWHVLTLSADGEVCACLRFFGREHRGAFRFAVDSPLRYYLVR